MRSSFALCTLIRAPVRETNQFANYYLNAGANALFLFFDDPEDPAVDVVAEMPGVFVTRCDRRFWEELSKTAPSSVSNSDFDSIRVRQRLATMAGLRMAAKQGCEWLIHLDSDELLFPVHRLHSELARVPNDITIVRFPPIEAVPPSHPKRGAFLDTALFRTGEQGCPPMAFTPKFEDKLRERLGYHYRRMLFRVKRRVALIVGLGRVFRICHYRGHIHGKSAVRVRSGIQWMYSHYPVPPAKGMNRLRTIQTVKVLHYDCQGYDSWRNKWKRRVLEMDWQHVRNGTRNTKRLVQFREFAELLRDGDEQGIWDLFQDMYSVTRYQEKALRLLGLLEETKAPEDLFDYR